MESAGHEIMCHSYTHGDDPLDYDEFEYETKIAADELRAMGLTIVNWIQPGTWFDPYPTGYYLNSTDFYGSPEDLLLREEFKAYEAYIDFGDGRRYSLPYTNVYGMSYKSGKDADTISWIDDLITEGQGGRLLWHSVNIGPDGSMSKADFETLLDYIVTKVTAGDLKVMTDTQQFLATEAV